MLGKSEGIVLRTIDYGEGNKILTILTKELGKIGVMAQGARKTKSRFSALSQPFIYAYFMFHSGSGLATLSQGEIINSFPSIRGDLYQTANAAYILELTDRLLEERKRSKLMYDLLLQSLCYMNEGKDYEVVARIFEVKVLNLFGYKPVFDVCSNCRKGHAPWFFSAREGGILCSGCRTKDPYAFLLGEGLPRLLHLFQTMDMGQLGTISLKESTKEQLKKAMDSFMDEHLGIHLKSRQFLQQLEKMEQIIPRKANVTDTKEEDI
ncbi:MAG TPA: DNA repair protein RecO [Bacillota bacterium]|nr:DNA repair protein RecO [Bacillota bacterium]